MIYAKYGKRVLDFILSLCSLIFLSPIFIFLIILGSIFMRGNPFFTQKRPGQNEKIFNLIKFRTMDNRKDSNGKLLPDAIRLNKYGRILRSTSLDELPELLNIIKGDMAIVGPRPLAIVYLPYYTNKEKHRHDVRPGLTGWAQVNGRNSISWDRKFNYDLEYIRDLSLKKDFIILLLTVKKVFVREGIGQGEEHPGSLHEIRKEWLDENGVVKEEFQQN